jgi:hypothetical protein
MKAVTFSLIVFLYLFMLINAYAGSAISITGESASGDTTETHTKNSPTGDPENSEQNIERLRKSVGAPGNKRFAFYDPSSREYIALFIGCGGYFPVADYGTAYRSGYLVSFTAGVYYINFLGLSPEIHVRYAAMDYRDDPLRRSASLSQVQVYPAIVYRYPLKLPRNTLTVYGRIWDGLSRVRYSSWDPYIPSIKRNFTEYLNVFGFSAGCYYDVWQGFLLGLDLGYSVVSTARKPLQSISLLLNVGWRIL